MHKFQNTWVSDFPIRKNSITRITETQAVVAAVCNPGFTGTHATLYIEELLTGDYVVSKYHLVKDMSDGEDVDRYKPKVILEEFERNKDRYERNVDVRFGKDVCYMSWAVAPSKVLELKKAARKFVEKNNNGRYRYRKAGGFLGWIFSPKQKRGVNCTDFVIKILVDAGIANESDLKNGPFNRPAMFGKVSDPYPK